VDDGRAQVTLGAVVGGLDVVTMQEDVEAIAVRAVALLEPRGLGLWSDVAVEDQPIGSVLDQQSAACERLGRDLLPGAQGPRAGLPPASLPLGPVPIAWRPLPNIPSLTSTSFGRRDLPPRRSWPLWTGCKAQKSLI
jgi:hypothetical protein